MASGKGTLLSVLLELDPFNNQTVGRDAGKAFGSAGTNYSAIPDGQQLTSATVSRDGRFVLTTSNKKQQAVYACARASPRRHFPGPADPDIRC